MSNIFFSLRNTIKHYASGSNVLIVATLLALVCANVPAISGYYNQLWELPVSLQIGGFNLFSHGGHSMTLLQFVNDALMAIFFFTVGLEIKREVLIGELSSVSKAALPIVAACGGMVLPVLVFFLIGTMEGGNFLNGCAIPMATDIAFSLGVLSMLGSRVPISLKIFLTTLAVADDIGGILVIAIFYGSEVNFSYLFVAFIILALMFILGLKFNVKNKALYAIGGIVVWYLFVYSGIHATISGVLVAFTIPADPAVAPKKFLESIRKNISRFPAREDEDLDKKKMLSPSQLDWIKQIESASTQMESPLQKFEDMLHSAVNMFILPIFAFANAGIYLLDMDMSSVFGGVTLAIIGGLVIGKCVGIFTFTWLFIKLGLSKMPQFSNWKMIFGVSMLGGIGFTVSLFIATLSFVGDAWTSILNDAKLGIILGSLISGVLGYLILKFTLPKDSNYKEDF